MHSDSRSSRIAHLHHIPISGEDVEVLVSAKEFHDRMFELIKGATRRIYLSALYLENDNTGRRILEALYDAKANNPKLDITVLVDFHRAQRGRIGKGGESGGNAQYYTEINQKKPHSISIYGLPVKVREFFGVMHLKGFVFDDQVLYSGASINDVYFHAGNRYRYDRYTLINSQGLADSLVEFVQRLHQKCDVLTRLNRQPIPLAKSMKRQIRHSIFELRRSDYLVPQSSGDEAPLHITPILGFGRRGNRLNKAIIDIIRSAKKEVVLYTPYFNLPSALRKALIKAMQHDVKVTLVVGDKTASDFYISDPKEFSTIGTLPYLYEMLLRGFVTRYRAYIAQDLLTIRLWKHDDNSFHVKGVSVDNRYYVLTGNNLNPRAWGLDLENALLLYDENKRLKQLFKEEYLRIISNTAELSQVEQLEHPRDYPAHVKKVLGRLKRIRADKMLKHFI